MRIQRLTNLLQLMLLLSPVQRIAAATQDFNADGKPDLLWHYRESGNRSSLLWYMNGESQTASVTLNDTSGNPLYVADPGWKIVGVADFNQDGKPDIVWQHQTLGDAAVWYMGGTGGNVLQTAAMLTPTPSDHAWRIVAVADCNLDTKPDLIWQHDGDAQKAVWIMNGTALAGAYMLPTGGVNWHITAAANFGGDGHPDILLYEQTQGTQAIWYMGGANGTDLTSGAMVTSGGLVKAFLDLDWLPLLALDLSLDGGPDIIMRHVTQGLNYTLRMSGAAIQSEAFLPHLFDNYWAMGNQSLTNSDWRLLSNRLFAYPKVCVFAGPAATEITLSNLNSLAYYTPYAPPAVIDDGVTIDRSVFGSGTWNSVAIDSHTDTFVHSLTTGVKYEYRMVRNVHFPPPTTRTEYFRSYIVTGIQVPAEEKRGCAIVLVDDTLQSQLTAEIADFKKDLVADGWRVIVHAVPRHDDGVNGASVNKANLTKAQGGITNLVRNDFAQNLPSGDDPGAKAVIILGHVTIPFAGSTSPDGHVDHSGAWQCDGFYGDAVHNESIWTDSIENYTSATYPWLSNTPADGSYDNNYFPKALEMFVGRIDFANIDVFGKTEVQLIKDYLSKAHKYKIKGLTWQEANLESVYQQAMVYNNHAIPGYTGYEYSGNDEVYPNASANSAALFGAGKLRVGDALFQTPRPVLFAFPAGSGWFNGVNFNQVPLEHLSQHLSDTTKQPHAVFFGGILGSYLGDWSAFSTSWTTFNNGYLRSLLGIPEFGLASMNLPTSGGRLRFEEMAMGAPIGSVVTRTVKYPDPFNVNPTLRSISLLGDPTLRLHIIRPPTNLTAVRGSGKVALSWAAGESGSSYYVYRSNSADGPFQRITVTFTGGTQADDNSPPVGSGYYYMVRGVKLQAVPGGSYYNLTLGNIAAL